MCKVKRSSVYEYLLDQIGYIGKAKNANLDIKEAPDGSGLYNKYAKYCDDLGFLNGKKNGYDYCCLFLIAAFIIAAEGNVEIGTKAMCQYNNSCAAGVKFIKQFFEYYGRYSDDVKTAEYGDIIIFQEGGNPSHVGFVYRIIKDDSGNIEKICTIEGNVLMNHCVDFREYKPTNSRILGFGKPIYAEEDDESLNESEKTKFNVGDIVYLKQDSNVYSKAGKDTGEKFFAYVYQKPLKIGEIKESLNIAHVSLDLTLKAYTGWVCVNDLYVFKAEEKENLDEEIIEENNDDEVIVEVEPETTKSQEMITITKEEYDILQKYKLAYLELDKQIDSIVFARDNMRKMIK